ncbi:alpha/beta hydrolase family protein [Rhodopirellula sp. JC639]|uniref:alpha/beta hydrolase family protein n=1 Tax=Stieleria mannarensis TaxID=2755585 RepID=UPI0016001C21|nr:prolyl oligopeptidase family serine peptidase [Rhodopirellula sp. JC639]
MTPDFSRCTNRPLFFGAILLTSLLFTPHVQAQDISRRQLEHQDYDVWNTMSSSAISNDGNWARYQIQSGAIDGEATLHVQHTESGREYVIPRGTDARFTPDNRFAVYRITPEKTLLKKLRKEKKAEHELPKSQLQILELESGALINLENVRSFKTPEDSGAWVACLLEKPSASDELEDDKPIAREVYEVTAEGLRRPAKKLKLKSRSQLARERGESAAGPEEHKTKPLKQPEPKPGEPRKSSSTTNTTDDDETSHDDDKQPGTPLVLIHLDSGIQRTYPNVDSYGFSKNGKLLAFVTSVKPTDTKESGSDSQTAESKQRGDNGPVDGVHVVDLDSMVHRTVAHGQGEYKNLAFSEDGSAVAFITNKDDYDAEKAAWTLYHWTSRAKQARKIATEGDRGIPEGWWVSPDSNQQFSEDGRRLYFETAPIPEQVIERRQANSEGREIEEDEEDEQAKLDVWHWQDPQLQPQQLLQAEIERKRDYRAVYDLRSKKIAQLATRQMPLVDIDDRSSAPIAVANTNMRYRKTLSWDVPGLQDAYLVDLRTGERELVLEAVKWNVRLSPEGKYLTWFDAEQKAWFAKSATKRDEKPIRISKGIKFALHDELNDRPTLPSAYGSPGWLTGDRALLIYDRYDIWQLDPSGTTDPICMTAGVGRTNDLRFRYLKLDPQSRAIDPAKPMMLSAFNRKTKASGFYVLDPPGDDQTTKKNADNVDKKNAPPTQSRLRRLIVLDEQLSGLQKAKDSDRVLFTRSTFRQCPDLWSSDTSFEKIYRVSDMNPQQAEYSWGDAELVRWKSSDGEDLDGILLKPDGFDASKKYPMMVYFYERNSDHLHRYYPPAAGRSIICHSFYVSRGYLVFIPDIPYRIGQPGPSAANSVIPGVEHLIAQGFVDRARIGMQGHSWGGYQTAYLVTKTDLFACAESGAPVSNMTSAYGGIRWGSGLSRMFQYERTQSRIGEDLWTARENYISNSPLFFADKINTPLLILHNDEDGAVPWYQGIELFVALRRLGKPAWMLNYNGDPHWVMGDSNRRDFATRMQQFFDHYLLGAPEPEWMAVGVPAVDKGKNFGLELLEPEKPEVGVE